MRPIVLALVTLTLAGCGGSGDALAPPARPAASPPLRVAPAGRVVHVGHRPGSLAFDTRTGLLAVALTGPDAVALVDGRSGRTVRRVSLPGPPRQVALARPGGPLLVTVAGSDRLLSVSMRDGRVRATATGAQPNDAAVAGRRAFVADARGRALRVIERGRAPRVLDAPAGPGRLAVTSGRDAVALVGARERALELYDTSTLRSLGRIDVGVGPTQVLARGAWLYVVDTRGNGLIEVSTDPLRIHLRVQVGGGPYGIAIDPVRHRFWVTQTATNRVVELTRHKLLRSFPTVRQPDSVAVDPASGRVFVAGRADGVLQLLDPPSQHG